MTEEDEELLKKLAEEDALKDLEDPRSKIPPETATEGATMNEKENKDTDTSESQNGAEAPSGPRKSDVIYDEGAEAVFLVSEQSSVAAIQEAGGLALEVDMNTVRPLLDRLQEEAPEAVLLLAFAKEQETATITRNTLLDQLKRINVEYFTVKIPEPHRTLADYCEKDREGFFQDVNKWINETAPKADCTLNYLDTDYFSDIEGFRSNISTGFQNLDRESGGLYSGLYMLAAIPSLGKTSFAVQMADQLATGHFDEDGHWIKGSDVLFFSLEQSRLELVTKSFARMTAQTDFKTAATSLSIRKGYRPQTVVDQIARYRAEVGDRISIIEGNFNTSIQYITDYTRRYIRRNGVRPVIFVDYLQLLQPGEVGGHGLTAKEVVDNSVSELKRLTRDLGVTVVAICSVNRANYVTPIDFESLKESGGIEYGSDVIWGLQLHCVSNFRDDQKITERRQIVKDEKVKIPREVDLVCLKNRFGPSSYTCSFRYFQANDYFQEAEPEEPPVQAGTKKKRAK